MKIEEIRKSSPWRVHEGGNQEKLSGCQAYEYLFQRNPKSMSAYRHINLNNLVTSSKKKQQTRITNLNTTNSPKTSAAN